MGTNQKSLVPEIIHPEGPEIFWKTNISYPLGIKVLEMLIFCKL